MCNCCKVLLYTLLKDMYGLSDLFLYFRHRNYYINQSQYIIKDNLLDNGGQIIFTLDCKLLWRCYVSKHSINTCVYHATYSWAFLPYYVANYFWKKVIFIPCCIVKGRQITARVQVFLELTDKSFSFVLYGLKKGNILHMRNYWLSHITVLYLV